MTTVTLYEHGNFNRDIFNNPIAGATYTLTADAPNLASYVMRGSVTWDNQVSSMIVSGGDVKIWDPPDFGGVMHFAPFYAGTPQVLHEGNYDFGLNLGLLSNDLSWNDRISSIDFSPYVW